MILTSYGSYAAQFHSSVWAGQREMGSGGIFLVYSFWALLMFLYFGFWGAGEFQMLLFCVLVLYKCVLTPWLHVCLVPMIFFNFFNFWVLHLVASVTMTSFLGVPSIATIFSYFIFSYSHHYMFRPLQAILR
jgi:hypothetical protein